MKFYTKWKASLCLKSRVQLCIAVQSWHNKRTLSDWKGTGDRKKEIRLMISRIVIVWGQTKYHNHAWEILRRMNVMIYLEVVQILTNQNLGQKCTFDNQCVECWTISQIHCLVLDFSPRIWRHPVVTKI